MVKRRSMSKMMTMRNTITEQIRHHHHHLLCAPEVIEIEVDEEEVEETVIESTETDEEEKK